MTLLCTTRSELYRRYFREAEWANFEETLWHLNVEGIVISRPHPKTEEDRLIGLSVEAGALLDSGQAIKRGRLRRGESQKVDPP